MADKGVRYKLTLDGKQFEVSLEKIDKKTNRFEKRLGGIAKGIGAAFAARAVIKGVTKLTNLWDVQAQALAQVDQGLKTTGNTAGKTLKELEIQAAALQDKSIFGDEDILKNVTAQLLTFTNIAGKEFDRTQQAALDLSARLGTDLKSSSIQLGKALNDPVANLSALSRSGIQFSKEQKKVINALAKSGKMAEAQTIILDELEKQYGGSAEAARKAGKGGFKALGNTLGDLGEIIGKRLLGSSGQFAEKLGDMTKAATRFVDVDMSDELMKTKIALNAELNVLKRGNVTVEQRKTLIEDVNKKYGEYLPNLLTEASTIEDIEKAQRSANKELLRKISIAARQELIQDAIEKAARKEKALLETQLRNEKIIGAAKMNTAKSGTKAGKFISNQIIAQTEKQFRHGEQVRANNVKKFTAEAEALQQRFGDVDNIYDQMFGAPEGSGATTPGVPDVAATPSPELKAGIQTIKSAAPKTFNINIAKFVENFSVNSETINEGADQTKETFVDMWLKMLADLQAVGG